MSAMAGPDTAHARRMALRASYVCAAVAVGAALAAYSLGSEGWSDLRYWRAQVAFGMNALLGLGFLASVTPD